MKNTIFTLLKASVQNLAILLAVLFFSISSFLSCTLSPIIANGKARSIEERINRRIDTRPPVDAFGLVMTETLIEPVKCLPSPAIKECRLAFPELRSILKPGLGSGLLVTYNGKPIFLTAAHVCTSFDSDLFEYEGAKLLTKSTTNTKIRTHKGEIIKAKIIKLDEKNDLCALQPARVYTSPVRISSVPPELGEKVWAISAPSGINYPGMSLIFSGYYSGKAGKFHHYTIPSRPGSSGSVVLNRRFEAVGMINAAYIKMESIGMGVGFVELKAFLDSI